MNERDWFLEAFPPPVRVAELAQQYPLGAYLTVYEPLPAEGWIEDRTENGILLRRPDGRSKTFLSWYGLNTARVEWR